MKQTKFEQILTDIAFTILLIHFIGALLFSVVYSQMFLREAFQSFTAIFTLVAFNSYINKKGFQLNKFDHLFELSFVFSTICIFVYCHEAFVATTTMIILFVISILLNFFTKKLNLDQ